MKPFLSDDGKMETNDESNVIIITDVPPILEEIKGLIAQVDLPERQVMIEARLADINTGALREIGTDWTMARANTEKVVAAGVGATSGVDVLGVVRVLNEGFSYNESGGRIALGDQIGLFGETYDLNMIFDALEERNVVEILANPRVTTLNNVPASIKIIEKIPYISSTNLVSGAGSSSTIEFEDAGVEIRVTPIVTPNGYVRMKIDLIQSIFRGRAGSDNLDPPLIDERVANTNVIVPDGNTAVLGGLRQLRNSEQISGYPWLHRAPLIGWLFKNKQNNQSKIELVLMITPSVVERTLGMNQREKDLYDKIETQWNLPDYFMDDVQTEEKR
jgi:type IV pilus assembly protein PilQ